MKRKLLAMLILFSVLLTNVSYANINDNQADSVFTTKTATLYSNKSLSVYLETINYSNYIGINTCQLQYHNGSSWTTLSIPGLPLPNIITSSHYFLSAGYDYSNYIGTGKYRFKLQVEADGNTRTIYSNAVTF